LIYNQFKNAATQIVQTEQFLPLAPIKSDLTVSTADYILNLQRRNCIDFDSKIIENTIVQRDS
jgi:F-type H+-transporting ATPase subunit gamma